MRVTLIAAAMLLAVAGCSSADPVEPTPASSPSPAVTVPAKPTPQPIVTGEVAVSSAGLDSLVVEPTVAPTRVEIQDLGIAMDVQPVGVDDDGQLEIPDSAAVAGWYRFGASPADDQGNVVLAAHVDDARIGLGPFASLRDIDEGATVDVALEDGSTVKYQVVRVEQIAKPEVDMDLVFAEGSSQQLVLVTCGGRFDWDTRHYEDNVMVWAEPVEGS